MAARAGPKGKGTAPTADDDLFANGLSRYHLEPPSWRAPWLADKPNSGYPQFYPTTDGQDEDQLTESAVKTGFAGRPIVQTEAFSAHQLIYNKIKTENILTVLARLATAVTERAQGRIPSYGPSTFRLPSRVTVNDQKRETWFNDLANPAIPLSKLSRNVPHGYAGEKRLEMLFARQAPLIRAVWYIRAISAIEIQASKTRPGFTIAHYTCEWTGVVQEFVRKQLAEVALPESVATPPQDSRLASSMGRTSARRVLSDGDLRQAWTAKFSYSLRILEAMYEEHLIDRDSFLRFLVQQVETSNVGQLPFVLFLVEEYVAEFLLSEPLSARLVSACLARLDDIPSEGPNPTIAETGAALTSLVRSFFISLPDAFVASPLWNAHSKELAGIMLTPDLEPALSETIRADLADLTARVEASSEGTHDADSVEPDELEMIQILDDIAFPTDLTTVHKLLFHKRRRRLPLASELSILFSWATTSDRSGSHRPYAVAALIALEAEAKPKMDIEAAFIGWVDRGLAPWDSAAVGGLLAELVRVGVVSYSLYFQRMIARGETEQVKEPPSLHLQLLRTVALYGDAGNPLAKRRIALRAGSSARADSKRLVDSAEGEFDKLLPNPNAFADSGMDVDSGVERDCGPLLAALKSLAKDGSHLGITRRLVPQKLAQFQKALLGSTMTLEDHAVFVQIFLAVSDFWGLLQYIILVLRSQPPRDLVVHVLDAVEGHLDTWTSMGELRNLALALLISHEGLKVSGITERRLVGLLRQLGAAGHLDPETIAQLEQDFQKLLLGLSATSHSQPQLLTTGLAELHSLAIDSSPEAIAQLATTVWYRYHAYDNWGQFVFEGAVQLLSNVLPSIVCAFLREINERLPKGVEPCATRWFATMTPASASATFGGPSAAGLAIVCTDLVSEGTISAASVVAALLPVWKTILIDAAAPPLLPSNLVVPTVDKTLQLRALETITSVFSTLICGDEPPPYPSVTTPSYLLRRQRAESRRMSLYTPPALPDIGRCLALLALQQELWLARGNIDDDKALLAGTLILRVSAGPSFKMAVARNPQSLATAMLDSPFIVGIPSAPFNRPKVLAALLLALKDGSTATPASLVSTADWDLFLSGLTIWRLAVSKVEVQSCLERLDLDTSLQDEEKAEALHSLSRHFLDRVCSGEGHTYLGEQVVRCYHGRASDELVSVAFSRLAEAVDGLADTASPERRTSSLTTLRCTGRLLNTLLLSGKASSRPDPLNLLLTAIKSCLEGLLDSDVLPQKEAVLHSTHLLEIALRCTPVSAPPETCELFKECLIPCAKLAATLSKDYSQESELAALLLDTCSHLLFSITIIAPTLRLPSFHTFLSSDIDIDALPNSIVQRLLRLFGFSSVLPLPNPWEMVDHADPGPLKDLRHNIGPIDLAAFDARIVESIPAVTALNDIPQSPATSSGHSERGLQTNFDFETPCTGLSVAARDHRRALQPGVNRTLASKYDAAMKKRAAAAQEIVIGDSPPPAASASTSAPPARAGKRKEPPAEVVVLSDDDEPVVVTRAPPAKRGRGAATGKATGRGGARKKPK